jgi:hypothetical protein
VTVHARDRLGTAGIQHPFLPSSRTVIAGVGRLVFDAEGDLSLEAGPHPALHSDFAALCATLS